MKYYLLPFLLLVFACKQEPTETKNDAVQEESVDSETPETPEEIEKDTVPEQEEMTESQKAEMESSVVPDEYVDLDWLEYEESLTQDFSFVIITSTKSYDAALKRAKEASEKLGYPMDLRGLHENKEIGLSLSKKVCEEEICGGGLDYPIYLPRSDWGDSKYVSVEYSDGFEGFTKGYYIVVVASGEKGDPVVKEALSDAKKFYKDAYAKTCGVWMGCGC